LLLQQHWLLTLLIAALLSANICIWKGDVYEG
jgi:hypothetical protein